MEISRGNCLTERELHDIANAVVESSDGTATPLRLQAYLTRLETGGTNCRAVGEYLHELLSDIRSRGQRQALARSRPISFRLGVLEDLKRWDDPDLVELPVVRCLDGEQSVLALRFRPLSDQFCREPVPNAITKTQRKAVEALLRLWATGSLPSDVHILLRSVEQEVPCGQFIARFLEDEISFMYSRGQEGYLLRSQEDLHTYLIGTLDTILQAARPRAAARAAFEKERARELEEARQVNAAHEGEQRRRDAAAARTQAIEQARIRRYLDEMTRQRAQITAIRQSNGPVRESPCWNCDRRVDETHNPRCGNCGGLICGCGMCFSYCSKNIFDIAEDQDA